MNCQTFGCTWWTTPTIKVRRCRHRHRRTPAAAYCNLPASPRPSLQAPIVRHQSLFNSFLAGPALISQRTAEQLGLLPAANRALLTLAAGSDCVLAAAVAAASPGDASAAATAVADGCIAVTAVQQHNLHLGTGVQEEFKLFVPPAGEAVARWRRGGGAGKQAGWLAGGAFRARGWRCCRPPLPRKEKQQCSPGMHA